LSDFSECVKFLQTRMRISVTTSEAQEKTVREIRARRHLVVHNRGLVNAKYLEETGGAYQLDTPIPIPLEYLEDAVYNLCLVVIQVDKTALQENYCKPAKVEPNIPSAMDNPI
jgi:hypothetical protein